MTLTLHDLGEFRRKEMESGALTVPPANFLQDLKPLLTQLQEEAGPQPASWSPDCELMAAMDLLEDIFRIRRGKLARIAELNPNDATTPTPKQLFEFESCSWFGLTETYRLLDAAVKDVCIKGEWSGRWGHPQPLDIMQSWLSHHQEAGITEYIKEFRANPGAAIKRGKKEGWLK